MANKMVNATAFWQLANKYTDKLDRAKVSAIAKYMVDGKIGWLDAQSLLDDLIDAATLRSFGEAKGRPNTVAAADGTVIYSIGFPQ